LNPFDERLAFLLELLGEAERELRELHYDAGFEGRSAAVGGRLRTKANALAVQRTSLEEIADGTFA